MVRFVIPIVICCFVVMAYPDDGFILMEDQSLLDIAVDSAKLESRSNDNSIYQLTLTRGKPWPHDYGKMELKLGEEKVRFSSGGHHSPEHHTVGAQVYGEKLANAVTKFFDIKPLVRKHPGYRLITKFESVHESYKKGDKILARLIIKNVGSDDFVFMQGGRQRGARDNQFAFSCQFHPGMLPDIGDPMNFGGIGSFQTIKPGESHSIEVDLSKWFNFEEEGSYYLRGSYYLEILEWANDHNTIWEEIVADEFSVWIRK